MTRARRFRLIMWNTSDPLHLAGAIGSPHGVSSAHLLIIDISQHLLLLRQEDPALPKIAVYTSIRQLTSPSQRLKDRSRTAACSIRYMDPIISVTKSNESRRSERATTPFDRSMSPRPQTRKRHQASNKGLKLKFSFWIRFGRKKGIGGFGDRSRG